MFVRFIIAAMTAGPLLLFSPPASAHHAGAPGNSGDTGPINTISATTAEHGTWSVSLGFESTSFDPLTDETLETAAAGAVGHAHVHSLDELQAVTLAATYGVSDDLMLTVRLPYLMRDGVRTGHFHGGVPEVEDEGGGSGFGDIAALLQWRVMRGQNTDIAVIAGVKAPTGEDDSSNDLGETFATEFQPSSGGWDIMLGAAMTRRAAHWSFDASGLYTLAGENDDRDDLGDRFAYGLAASYRVLGHPPHHMHAGIGADYHGPSVDLALELNGEWHGRQHEGSEVDPNSGGSVLFLSPGVRVVQGSVAGYLTVGAPILSDFRGIQAEPEFRLTAGISRRF